MVPPVAQTRIGHKTRQDVKQRHAQKNPNFEYPRQDNSFSQRTQLGVGVHPTQLRLLIGRGRQKFFASLAGPTNRRCGHTCVCAKSISEQKIPRNFFAAGAISMGFGGGQRTGVEYDPGHVCVVRRVISGMALFPWPALQWNLVAGYFFGWNAGGSGCLVFSGAFSSWMGMTRGHQTWVGRSAVFRTPRRALLLTANHKPCQQDSEQEPSNAAIAVPRVNDVRNRLPASEAEA